MNYQELRSQLLIEEEKNNVFRRTDGPHPSFELWCYTPAGQVKGEWNQVNSLARGLVLDTLKERIYYVMPKFHNFGQNGIGLSTIPKESFRVETKWDGSMIVAWHDSYADLWRCSTKGSFNSEQAVWAEKYLNMFGPLDEMNTAHTYIFEAIYPENRIVVDYLGESTMVPLTSFDEHGNEIAIPPNLFPPEAFWPNTAQKYSSIEELLELAKSSTYNTEGWVVRFEGGLRIKIKTQDYLRVHRLIAGITEKRIYEVLIAGIEPAAAAAGLPDEFHREFLAIAKQLLFEANKRYDSVAFCMRMALSDAWTRKDWAQWANSAKDKWVPVIVFGILDKISRDIMIRNILKIMQKEGFVCNANIPIS